MKPFLPKNELHDGKGISRPQDQGISRPQNPSAPSRKIDQSNGQSINNGNDDDTIINIINDNNNNNDIL